MAKDRESNSPPTLAVKPDVTRKSRPPTSRLSRLARLGALAPLALPVAIEGARRLAGVQRSGPDERRAEERALADARKAAHALLKTLGEMKGLPLKIGQMASYIDGIAPPGYEDKVKNVLRSLQEKAPPLSAEAAARVVEQDFGSPPESVFAAWTREPFAAASIGQVHRATTRGGEIVAVKVQYPGIDRAIENDLKSLSFLEAFSSPLLRKYHTKQTLEDIKEVFLAELDYRREASMADAFRRMHRGVPEIVIPRVYHSLSSRRVLTAELVEGAPYAEFCEKASQEERDQAGLTIWRFMLYSMFHHGVLYADPHPGNYRFLGGGRVAFLDFGCVKVLPDDLLATMKRAIGAALDDRWPEFDREVLRVLGCDRREDIEYDLYRDYILRLLTPIVSRDEFEWSPEVAREAVAFLVRGHKDRMAREHSVLGKLPKPLHPPPESTFLNRLQWGLASILGGLRSKGRYRPITEPWIRAARAPIP